METGPYFCCIKLGALFHGDEINHFDMKILRVSHNMMKDIVKKKKSSIILCILVFSSFLCCYISMIADIFKYLKKKKTPVIPLKVFAVLNLLI